MPSVRSLTSKWFVRPDGVEAAWRVSLYSVLFTVCVSSAVIVVGVRTRTVALVALGAVGFVDGVGSAALAYHFHHARRHDQLSARLERIAHHVVLLGLVVVSLAAIVLSATRLFTGDQGRPTVVGIALSAVSCVALVALSARKRVISRRVSSPALLTDSYVSGVGSIQAAIALAGIGASDLFRWDWADPVAALLVGCGALVVAVWTWTRDLRA